MTTFETVGNSSQTLAQRMARGRIPVSEALRYAMILADALRKIHESGRAHGAVSPSCVAITRTGLELLPAPSGVPAITPYTAPELVQGMPADSRSDIFSLGAILYELLTGRALFQGDSPGALSAAIVASAPPPSGSPLVDRLVAGCIAKDPAARLPRVQKLVLELKLLAVAVRRNEVAAAMRPAPDPTFRTDIKQLVERVARLEQVLQATDGRLERVERALEAVSGELERLDRSLKSQNGVVESVKAEIAQTDDLVERAVEALESLQAEVLEHSDDPTSALK